MVTVRFEPGGHKVFTKSGVTILGLVKDVGVRVKSECGGKGICGKCRIIVEDQTYLDELTKTEMSHLSQREIRLGYRLACCTVIRGDIVVQIPEESRVGARRIQIIGVERATKLSPLVKKYHLTLPEPTLRDIRSDVERLLDRLSEVYGLGGLNIDYDLLKIISDILRDAQWNVTVTVWNDQEIVAIEAGDTSNVLYGFAVDIGTSKIAGCLVDLTKGEVIGTGFIENPQLVHGLDFVSRITYAIEGEKNLKRLQSLVIKGINSVLSEACNAAKIKPKNIYEMTVVGNTAMHHFFLAIQPRYLALAPFTPVVKRSLDIKARVLEVKINPCGNIHILPLIAGYVGADAIGDMLSSGIYESGECCLMLDVGTNGEVFLSDEKDIISCSCAAGPAFEGVHIKHGMKAYTGAIEKIQIDPEPYEVEYETIDGAKPVGICGSGVVDAVAEMFKWRIIDCRGKFNDIPTPRLMKVNGRKEFVVAWKQETGIGKDITVTQQDIRQILLAKAAMHAGCAILMNQKKVAEEDINRLFIAGAFGNYINPESAKFIGLIPEVPTKKIRFLGNAALSGAKMVLTSREARKTAEALSTRTGYVELAVDPNFKMEFVNSLYLPYRDLDRYPSVEEHFRKLKNDKPKR